MSKHTMKFKWRKFGSALRSYREDNGFGLRQVARGMKVHHATWCRAESGKPVTVPVFILLCEWMNANPFQYASRTCTRPLTSGQDRP